MCMEHYAAGHQLSQYSNSASMWTLLEIQDIQQAGVYVPYHARKLAGRHNNARQTPRAGSMHRFTQTPVTHLVPWCSNEV